MFPLWIDLVLVGIAVSGFMTIRTSIQERKMEKKFIEQYGDTYMKRIREERKEFLLSKK